MEKSFAVESVDVIGEAGSGKFEALVSVFNNVDAVRDVVMSHGFDRAIKELDPPPVVWSHFWHIPPIGNTLDWDSTEKGLRVKGELFVGADDKHQYADMVYAAMKSRDGRKAALREFSFSYDIPDGGMKVADRDDGPVQELHEIFPVHEVGPCLKGCNPSTELLVAPKSGLSLADNERIVKIARAKGMTVEQLLKELEENVREETYPPEMQGLMADLMLAFPDH